MIKCNKRLQEQSNFENYKLSQEALKAIIQAKKAYEEHMFKSIGVKEDELEDSNLGKSLSI